MVSSIDLAQHDAFEKRIPESILQLKPYVAHSKPSIPNIARLKMYNLQIYIRKNRTVNFDINYMIFYVKKLK